MPRPAPSHKLFSNSVRNRFDPGRDSERGERGRKKDGGLAKTSSLLLQADVVNARHLFRRTLAPRRAQWNAYCVLDIFGDRTCQYAEELVFAKAISKSLA